MLRVAIMLSALVAMTYAALTLDAAAKNKFVDLHNKYRKATGASMPDLTWDNEMATYAAGLADQCIFRHDPAHKYGENIYWASNAQSAIDAAEGSSKNWKSEIQFVDAAWGCYHGQTADTCGHYSQQVWKKTTKIGCAVSHCSGATMVFCEYNPKGNAAEWDMDTMSVVWPKPY